MDIKTLTPDDNGQVDWPALSPDRKAVVTVGVFDGMHQGHCAVIGKVVELARQTDSFAVVVLFDPRPGLVHRYAAEHDGAELPADAVDVEVFSGDEVVRRNIQAIHAAGKAVVGSNHDFGGTPDKADLLFRLRKMQELGADIPKIAVMPRCPGDVIALLDATQEMSGKYADRPIITMSMGAGVVSRLCGEYFGSAMTFGAVGQVSAPGQIPVEELNAAMDILHRALAPRS